MKPNSALERELTPEDAVELAIARRFLSMCAPIRTLSFYATGLAVIIEHCSGALMSPAAVEIGRAHV